MGEVRRGARIVSEQGNAPRAKTRRGQELRGSDARTRRKGPRLGPSIAQCFWNRIRRADVSMDLYLDLDPVGLSSIPPAPSRVTGQDKNISSGEWMGTLEGVVWKTSSMRARRHSRDRRSSIQIPLL